MKLIDETIVDETGDLHQVYEDENGEIFEVVVDRDGGEWEPAVYYGRLARALDWDYE
jgi:hypothetical protein